MRLEGSEVWLEREGQWLCHELIWSIDTLTNSSLHIHQLRWQLLIHYVNINVAQSIQVATPVIHLITCRKLVHVFRQDVWLRCLMTIIIMIQAPVEHAATVAIRNHYVIVVYHRIINMEPRLQFGLEFF